MGDLPRLRSLLNRLVAMHRLAPGAENLWLTEQGYASNAQLGEVPWSEARRATLKADSDDLAWRANVSAFSQFLLRDGLVQETLALRARTGDPRAAIAGTWATGLVRENFTAKPALAMFRAPIVARKVDAPPPPAFSATDSPFASAAGRFVEVWGRARHVYAPTLVQVQSSVGGATYTTVFTAATDANGIFDGLIALPRQRPGTVRFLWLDESGNWQVSPTTEPQRFPAGRGGMSPGIEG